MEIPFNEIISKTAQSYDLNSNWLKAIIRQESNFNPYALRLEPTFSYYCTPELFAKKLGVTLQTEICTQKMSWGLGQLMGSLIRELGMDDSMGKAFLPETNILLIAKNLVKIQKSCSTIDDIFAVYNGGLGALKKVNGKYINQSYIDSVKKHLQFFETGA